jgi:uncharacterized protein YegP (UPF0339 family)
VAAKFVFEKDPAGRFRFRLVSQGRVLASSESYTTKRAAQNAIASVKAGAVDAPVEDTTLAGTPDGASRRPAKSVKKTESAAKAVKRKAATTVPDAIVPARRKATGKRASGRKAGTTETASPS